MSSYIEICLDTSKRENVDEQNPVIRIELPMGIGSLDEVLDFLIKPALLAASFHPESVNNILYGEEQ